MTEDRLNEIRKYFWNYKYLRDNDPTAYQIGCELVNHIDELKSEARDRKAVHQLEVNQAYIDGRDDANLAIKPQTNAVWTAFISMTLVLATFVTAISIIIWEIKK